MSDPLTDPALIRHALAQAGGVTAKITRATGQELEVTAIFERASRLVGSGGELEVLNPQPMIRAASADVAAVKAGDLVEVGGQSYLALPPEPDGTGETVIALEASA